MLCMQFHRTTPAHKYLLARHPFHETMKLQMLITLSSLFACVHQSLQPLLIFHFHRSIYFCIFSRNLNSNSISRSLSYAASFSLTLTPLNCKFLLKVLDICSRLPTVPSSHVHCVSCSCFMASFTVMRLHAFAVEKVTDGPVISTIFLFDDHLHLFFLLLLLLFSRFTCSFSCRFNHLMTHGEQTFTTCLEG